MPYVIGAHGVRVQRRSLGSIADESASIDTAAADVLAGQSNQPLKTLIDSALRGKSDAEITILASQILAVSRPPIINVLNGMPGPGLTQRIYDFFQHELQNVWMGTSFVFEEPRASVAPSSGFSLSLPGRAASIKDRATSAFKSLEKEKEAVETLARVTQESERAARAAADRRSAAMAKRASAIANPSELATLEAETAEAMAEESELAGIAAALQVEIWALIVAGKDPAGPTAKYHEANARAAAAAEKAIQKGIELQKYKEAHPTQSGPGSSPGSSPGSPGSGSPGRSKPLPQPPRPPPDWRTNLPDVTTKAGVFSFIKKYPIPSVIGAVATYWLIKKVI